MTKRSSHLIAIVGETASGKSALALDLAERYNGEIICADSRTVYRGMDIGTAKSSREDQERIPHHLLDIVTPDEPFNVARFKELADQVIADIQSRGKVPLLVGGTGLYIDAIVFNYAFLPLAETEERQHLQSLNTEQLQKLLEERGINPPTNFQNPRHLIRALETNGAVPVKSGLRKDTLMIGLAADREKLNERISQRTKLMLASGLESEVRALAEKYGWHNEAMSAVGYHEWQAYFEGTQSLDETAELITRNTQVYAKRQRTWFKRNKNIHWISDSEHAMKLVARFLKKSE